MYQEPNKLIKRIIKKRESLINFCDEVAGSFPAEELVKLNYINDLLGDMRDIIENLIMNIEVTIDEQAIDEQATICNDCIQAMEEETRKCRETIGDD